MSTEFGQNLMRLLDQGSVDHRNKITQIVDDFIRTFPQMLRGGQITQYTVETILRRFKEQLIRSEGELMHKYTIVASRQIYQLFQKNLGSMETDFVQRKKDLVDTKQSLEETQKDLNDANNRVQSLANLIEEADVSIQSLMEERDSLHTSVSETIRKYNEVQKDFESAQAKIKKYEAQLAAMENEASTALDNLASKLADQERKWQEKFEREEKKWQLRLLEATMKQEEGKEPQTPFKNDDFKDFDPNKEETTAEKDETPRSNDPTESASGAS
ncbi:MAG: hypothetical protein ACW981_21665 [Candidatus Hodarchaeales archaeon]|jgi:chromosome segregation ATPase